MPALKGCDDLVGDRLADVVLIGMTDSGGSWLVGNSRPIRRCQLENKGGSMRLARLATWVVSLCV